MLQCRRRAPLRPTPIGLARRQPSTVIAYRRAVLRWVAWMTYWQVAPRDAGEVDDLLLEWHCQDQTVTRSLFAQAICGVEMAVPWLRRQLHLARQELADWEVVGHTQHHLPLPKALCLLLSSVLATLGYGRLAAGMIVQQAVWQRPGELLKLRRMDVTLPEDTWFGLQTDGILNLGAKKGTKAKRQQSVRVPGSERRALLLLRELVRGLNPEDPLIPTSYEKYGRLLRASCTALGLSDYTPHSARAGFATDKILSGASFVEVREAGRWVHDASLRIYLDAVAVAAAQASAEGKMWSASLAVLDKNFAEMFAWWPGAGQQPSVPLPMPVRVAIAPLAPRAKTTPRPTRFRFAERRVSFAGGR